MKKPKFNNTPNIEHKTTEGKPIWQSRSVCVCIKLIINFNGVKYSLITQRGEAVSHTGKWCLPCGYIDYDETIVEAAVRELFEETGITTTADELELYEVMDDPKRDDLQNVTFHYKLELDSNPFNILNSVNRFINEGHTNGESTNSAIVTRGTVDEYEFAFNHNKRANPEI